MANQRNFIPSFAGERDTAQTDGRALPAPSRAAGAHWCAGRAAECWHAGSRHCRAGCEQLPDSAAHELLPSMLLAGECRGVGWEERVKAADQPSANMRVAAEASVPRQIIIKPDQNNANYQPRLVLKNMWLTPTADFFS